MNIKPQYVYIGIGIASILTGIQWMRFKKALDAVYTNGASANNPQWMSNMNLKSISGEAVSVSKFPFSATVTIGKTTNFDKKAASQI